MKTLNWYPITLIAGLLMVAPAFAQTPQPQSQKGQVIGPKVVKPTGLNNQGSSSATKQKTDGDGITEVGPGSKAYYGNTQHSRF